MCFSRDGRRRGGQVAWYIGSATAELEGADPGVNPGFAQECPAWHGMLRGALE